MNKVVFTMLLLFSISACARPLSKAPEVNLNSNKEWFEINPAWIHDLGKEEYHEHF